MDNNAVITIKNLIKRFPMGNAFFTALKGINLTLNTGEFTGLVGPSGSGKTTLLNIIGGLDSATEGSVSVLNHSMDNTSHNERALLRRKHMGFIFQNYNLLPVYTCLLYTSDPAYDSVRVDLVGRRIIKKIFFLNR